MLERLWHKNQAILRSIISNILLDPSGVDDVLQEAFRKLLQSKIHFSTPEETYNYIRKVVLNTGIDHYRCHRRRNARFTHCADENLPSSSPYVPNPLTLLMEKERAEVQNSILEEVRKTLKELPPEQREAIDITFNRNHQKIKDLCKEKGIPYL